MKLDVVILAAGVGSRMNSYLPKALQPIAGMPMIRHLINTSQKLNPHKIHVVIGHLGEQIREHLADVANINFVMQSEQLGTAHAVMQVIDDISADLVLILYADVPLISGSVLRQLITLADTSSLALLSVQLDDPKGYGRIIRDVNAQIAAIVEDKDANTKQLAINEINTGILVLPFNKLKSWLSRIDNDNAQQEYYLTDVIDLAVRDHYQIKSLMLVNDLQVQGANNKQQLAILERYYQQSKAQQLLERGVTLIDPARTDIRGNLHTGKDVTIDVNCIFIGDVSIGDNVTIEANCIIKNTEIASGSKIYANSYIENAVIGVNVTVGPFARIRPNTNIDDHAHVGNFVEIKNSSLRSGVKVGHLTYLGDTDIGEQTNIGAGTITCNYDGKNKYHTQIGANGFIGSNTSLVAPVKLDDNVTTAAGSVITKDVLADHLAIARGKQRNIANWKSKQRKD